MKRRKQEESVPEILTESLQDADPEIAALLEAETSRQQQWLNLVASENVCSRAVLEALGSPATNKYSEGYPGARHYGGCDVIDQIELLCRARALQLFGLSTDTWGVNVQSLSGTGANYQVYAALMRPHDRMMGLNLTHGGHMSFGYHSGRVKVSAASIIYETLPYNVDLNTGVIDYADLESTATRFRPRVIVAGASSYCQNIDYARIREICNKIGAFLVADIAHTAGLIATRCIPGPFQYADVVTTATQKTLRGPRGALIYYKKELENSMNFSVFPSSQGGPHNHTIAALAVALREAMTPEFAEYQRDLLENLKAFEQTLIDAGYTTVGGRSDIHMLVLSLADKGIDGSRVSAACERAHIAISATTIPGDTYSLPRAIRLGTTTMTSRGFKKDDFIKAAKLVDRVIKVAISIHESLPVDGNKLKDFKVAANASSTLQEISQEIKDWVENMVFPSN